MGKVVPIKKKEWRLVKVTKGSTVTINIRHFGIPQDSGGIPPDWFTIASYPIEKEAEAIEQFESIIAPVKEEILREA